MQVLARGIVFIDLAIAQIAGCGVVLADRFGFEAEGIAVQVAALAAALGGALLLTWTERRLARRAGSGDRRRVRPRCDRQRAAARQQPARQRAPARSAGRPDPLGAAIAAGRGPRWSTRRSSCCGSAGGSGSAAPASTCLFALAVTVSVQLVGLYLVFATLIVPPLATRTMERGRLAASVGDRRGGLRGRASCCRPRSTCRAVRSSCGCWWCWACLACLVAAPAGPARRRAA